MDTSKVPRFYGPRCIVTVFWFNAFPRAFTSGNNKIKYDKSAIIQLKTVE